MYLTSSGVSGVVVCAAMQPADTVLTRMYNQNTVTDPVTGRVRGALYTNPFDCLWKTAKTEGIKGWYKGECERSQRSERSERSCQSSMLICRNYRPLPAHLAAHGHYARRQRAHRKRVQKVHRPRISRGHQHLDIDTKL